ncbi:NAD(P)/FAD-dependent oxidoreductase [Tropicimonas isoalkanivorans]|uniref:Cytochrome-dependent sulfide dehydrogenase (Flavoprotein) n=1 Tax=Tropicimonas isoalkanivorans TaxID=441112 RepID=A0A1I1P6G3_9RHOB|nr:NAD(P)/FAD-dependent oxidoreductase [Tropicimonas isoalkanivorans]SFD05551.1 cytochrome-dependent sulfide dehydrogenase (flavoprotein) [Tropicimonas isoalkanivorans]
MVLDRRHFLGTSVALTATLAAPVVWGQANGRPKVVVIGGGPGGATAARYIAKDSDGGIDVTLVEPTRDYYTCFFSNLYIGGFRDLASLRHSYGALASVYGINVVHETAVGVDRDARTVTLSCGAVLPYDRLVISPGIDFVEGSVPGWDVSAQHAMPHAYKAGSQTELAKAQVAAMPEGGLFCMIAPPNPFRCPPGPYERVSMVAHVLKQTNPRAKILIADPKEKYSKQALFEEGWQAHYTGMIDRLGPDFGGGNVMVDPGEMTVDIDGEVTRVDVCNVIPAQKAGRIAELAGLTDETGYCPIVPATMQSRLDAAVHVLGDAAHQGDMPKSAFAANSQAKVAAMAIRGALTGSKVFPAKFSNTCWSLISPENGVKVGATYEATEEKIAKVDGFISQTDEEAALRQATFEESLGWYAGITADIFG